MSAVIRNQQMRAAAFAYENASPVDPAEYDFTDADGLIASGLIQNGEVADVVMELRNAADFLNWIAYNVHLPREYMHAFRDMDRRAKAMSSRAAELVEKECAL